MNTVVELMRLVCHVKQLLRSKVQNHCNYSLSHFKDCNWFIKKWLYTVGSETTSEIFLKQKMNNKYLRGLGHYWANCESEFLCTKGVLAFKHKMFFAIFSNHANHQLFSCGVHVSSSAVVSKREQTKYWDILHVINFPIKFFPQDAILL